MNQEKKPETLNTGLPGGIDALFKELGKTLLHHEGRVQRGIAKLIDPSKGKPSKQALSKLFESLYDVVKLSSQIERCTVGHLQAVVKGLSLQIRSLAEVLKERGVVTDEELKKAVDKLADEDQELQNREIKRREEESLSGAVEQATKEANKREEDTPGDVKNEAETV